MSIFALTSAALVATGGPVASSSPTAAALADEPVLEVSPLAVQAGSSVTVSGQCEVGERAAIVAEEVHTNSYRGSLTPALALDGTFDVAFPVPREAPGGTWQFRLNCLQGDAGRSGPTVDVAVTPGTPEALVIEATPSNPIAGDAVSIEGQGCLADGRSLGEAIVSVSLPYNNAAPDVFGTVTPSAAGAFHITLQLPADYPARDTYVIVECRDIDAALQPMWSRYLQQPITVVAAPASTTTTSSRAPVVVAAAEGLPKTGTSSSLTTLGIVLALTGLALFGWTRRNRMHQS
jgi:LPXTG-motif cell wall-anchored protein